MIKAGFALRLAMVSSFLLCGIAVAQDIRYANYGSAVVRDGVFNDNYIGHAAVVIQPLFGDSPNSTDRIIAQANGAFQNSSTVTYATFLGAGNTYWGHFRTYDSQWSSSAFRADVV